MNTAFTSNNVSTAVTVLLSLAALVSAMEPAAESAAPARAKHTPQAPLDTTAITPMQSASVAAQ